MGVLFRMTSDPDGGGSKVKENMYKAYPNRQERARYIWMIRDTRVTLVQVYRAPCDPVSSGQGTWWKLRRETAFSLYTPCTV